jgi:hypothetical protein
LYVCEFRNGISLFSEIHVGSGDGAVSLADDTNRLEKHFVELGKEFNWLGKGFEGWEMDSMMPETQYQRERIEINMLNTNKNTKKYHIFGDIY